MSTPLATYSFLPWLRQGLANQIQSEDFADFDPAVKLRVQVNVQLTLSAKKLVGDEPETAPVNRPVALFGPGDIQGIESRAIVRVEPRDWITNFEPNYLPHIEFYDEDFAWRYTPAAPDTVKGRLRPWIMLLVLKEPKEPEEGEQPEFTDGQNIRNKPLPYIDVPDLNVFPTAEELWAWAHVHVNRSLAANDTRFKFTSEDMAAVIPRFRAVLDENPDLAYSRIASPRKLAENTAYHAFLVPVFETGRLAGLGLDPAASPNATFSAWAPYPSGTKPEKPEGQSFPYYYRWYFRTGTTGDFESLVRLLQPKPVDNRVGTRAMDVQAPGLNVRGLDKPEELKGILKLGGALQVPRKNFQGEELIELEKYENWADPFPRPIQEDLAKLVNLADNYAETAAEIANSNAGIVDPEDPDPEDPRPDPDPLITPPLYGTWHALTKRLLKKHNGAPISPNDNWVHELNLDPRFRVGAGFGTRVVQDRQEKYVDAAWEQIGRVLEANQRIRLGQFGKVVSFIWHDRHLSPLLDVSRQKALLLVAPLNKRVLAGEFTVHHRLGESFVQPAMVSTALRRVIRPRGRLLKAMPFDDGITPDNLISRVNDGEVSAAPPKVTPPGVVTVNELADEVLPKDSPPAVIDLIRRYPWLRWAPLIVALVIALLVLLFAPVGLALAIATAVAAGAVFLYRLISRWTDAVRASDRIREENRTPESVDDLPRSPDFRITEPGSGFTPSLGGTDSVEAVRFKQALKDSYTLISASAEAGAIEPKETLDLAGIAQGMIATIDPELTIPRRVLAGIFLPPRIRAEIGEQFVEAMAYPEFDTPMYEPLKNISAELFLPNLNLIEQNSITLLESNQKFIESYMVGLNHEFARELLWREYPTDQRGSYFRQFWDVRSFFNSDETLDDAALKEKLRDIPPLHKWRPTSKLGSHDNREQDGDDEEEIVLVIRGELLKRYPTAVIYAHRACWQRESDGTRTDEEKHPCLRSGEIDNTKERRLAPLADEAAPPRDIVRTPLYEAKVDPDVYFFGFDLTVEYAKGGTGANPNDDPGWFFVIKERPGEPRFGLDLDKQPKLNVWNDLSWADVQPGAAGNYIRMNNATPTFSLIPTGEDEEKTEQYKEDKNIAWNKDMSSADLAYVLFQAPVLIAVHASEMLPKN